MLLCDDIIFWHEHRQQPRFESGFDMLLYEMECGFRSFNETFRRMLLGMPAVAKAMEELAKNLNEAMKRR